MKTESVDLAKALLKELQREDAEHLAAAKARLQAEVFDSPEVILAVAEQIVEDFVGFGG